MGQVDFSDAVAQMGKKVASLKDSISTEEATKNAFIMPFIGSVLGYDVFNSDKLSQAESEGFDPSGHLVYPSLSDKGDDGGLFGVRF